MRNTFVPGLRVRRLATVTLALALLAPGWGYASEEKKDDDKKKEPPGLEVGTRAPAFKLKDQKGRDVALGDLLKKTPVALVFFRSADW